MKRTPEVLDGWFESSSMPFAEYHYPLRTKNSLKKVSPGILSPSMSLKQELGFTICTPSPVCFLAMRVLRM